MVLKATVQKQSLKLLPPNVSLKSKLCKSIAKLWTGYLQSNDYKCQLSHTGFNQISDRKHDIHLYG